MLSVLTKPPPVVVDYTSDQGYAAYNTIVTTTLVAPVDAVSGAQDLVVGSSSNMTVEACGDVRIYTSNGALEHYLVTESAGIRQDIRALNITSAPSPSNNQVIATIAGLVIHESDSYQHLGSTGGLGFKFDDSLLMSGNLTVQQGQVIGRTLSVGGKVDVGSDMMVQGDMFSKSMNVWKDNPSASADTDIDRIGFGFRVSDTNHLELVRYVRYHDSNLTTVSQRVAVFGNGNVSPSSASDAVAVLDPLDYFNKASPGGASNVLGGAGVTSVNIASEWSTNAVGDLYYTTSRIGIGTSEPVFDLHVHGTLGTSALTTRSLVTDAYWQTSDARMKSDIADIDDDYCLTRVNEIKVSNFKFNKDTTNRQRIGFIAQQVEDVEPLAITVGSNDTLSDCKFLDTVALLGMSYGAIHKLTDDHHATSDLISSLSDRLTALETMLRESSAMRMGLLST
jgi:hypothetical protein